MSVDGLLLVDKPAGMTSHDVVDIVRRAYGERSIGHLGTLDPFATGLLVLLLGRCTRLATFIENEPKTYDATIHFGAETSTDDTTGDVIRTAPLPTLDAIEASIPDLTGAILQVPPAYSAKKIDGARAYALARDGVAVELPPVQVTVHEWRIRDVRGRDMHGHDLQGYNAESRHPRDVRPDTIDVTIVCGGGTYIRALARDLGRHTESAAHLTALRRTQSGGFHVRDAVSLDAIRSDHPPSVRRLRVEVE